jgi:hypothetical protein
MDEIEAVARVLVKELTETTYDDLHDRHSLSHSGRSVRGYWLNVAEVAINAYRLLDNFEEDWDEHHPAGRDRRFTP